VTGRTGGGAWVQQCRSGWDKRPGWGAVSRWGHRTEEAASIHKSQVTGHVSRATFAPWTAAFLEQGGARAPCGYDKAGSQARGVSGALGALSEGRRGGAASSHRRGFTQLRRGGWRVSA